MESQFRCHAFFFFFFLFPLLRMQQTVSVECNILSCLNLLTPLAQKLGVLPAEERAVELLSQSAAQDAQAALAAMPCFASFAPSKA